MAGRVRHLAECFLLMAMGLLALTATGALIWVVWPKGWRGDGAASWFQAIGAIVGIGIAIYVPWRQRVTSDREQRIETMRQRLTVARRLAFLSADYLVACEHYLAESSQLTAAYRMEINVRALQLVIDSARGLEALDRDNVATPLLFTIRTQADEMIRKAEGRHSVIEVPSLSRAWRDKARSFNEAAQGIQINVERQAKELGIDV